MLLDVQLKCKLNFHVLFWKVRNIIGFKKGCPKKSLKYSGNGDDVWTDKVDKKLGRKKL